LYVNVNDKVLTLCIEFFNRNAAVQAKQYCENHLKTVGERLTVQPHICGYICICCGFCSSNNLDAIDYYSNEEAQLNTEVRNKQI